jgi:hypothetical protein
LKTDLYAVYTHVNRWHNLQRRDLLWSVGPDRPVLEGYVRVTRRFTTGSIFDELTAATAAAAAAATAATATDATVVTARRTAAVRLSEAAIALLQRQSVCLLDRRRAPAIDNAQWSSCVSARRYVCAV